MKTIWTNKVFFGTRKEDNARIYLSAPSWDCGWYWGFGYLGNKNEHYHLSGYKSKQHCIADRDGKFHVLTESRNKNIYDCLLEDYDLNPNIKSKLWEFCELIQTAYSLKETAELLGRGGSHYTSNPCKDTIVNTEEVNRINEVVLPAIFDAIHALLNRNVEKLYEELSEIFNSGHLTCTIEFMVKNKIHTDNLKDINGLTKGDINKIHSAYWKAFHANKK